MSSKDELVTEFWAALKSDRVMMLGLTGVDDDHTRPMTAQVDDANSEIWFFSSCSICLSPLTNSTIGLSFWRVAINPLFDQFQFLLAQIGLVLHTLHLDQVTTGRITLYDHYTIQTALHHACVC